MKTKRKTKPHMATYYKKRDKRPVCLHVGCEDSIHGGCRGLCYHHYKAARTQVRRGEETWESLEEKSLCNKIIKKEKPAPIKPPHRYGESD